MVALSGGSALTVPAENLNGAGPAVKVGVRPEKIRLQPEADEVPSGWNGVTGTMRVATYVGVSHQFTVDGPEGRTLTVYAQNLGAETVPAPGSRVRLVWRPEHTFVVRPSEPLADWEEET